MRLNLIRQILTSFLLVCAGFAVAWVAALHLLQTASHQLAKLALPPGAAADGVERVQQFLQGGEVVVLLFGLAGFLAGLIGMAIAASQATRMLGRLKQATQQLANVVLDQEFPDSGTAVGDDLEHDLREMMRKIQMSQQLCLDASPLTRLPGNIAIEQVLKWKMLRDEKFALCYVDLDDFKAFNDRYGYARGSELIKLAGEVIYGAKGEHGDTDDFVGHIGGDDFVLITSPDNVETVCQAIIAAFDAAVPGYYDADDRLRGYIEGTDRYGVTRRFPLMSISIAVVSDARRNFTSPLEIARVATEIKDYVKTLPGSNYLIDRRTSQRGEA